MSRRGVWRAGARALAAAALLAVAPLTGAQPASATPQVEQDPPPFACLQVLGSPGLDYPPGYAERGRGAVIRVRLTFRAPDAAPQADVFFDGAGDPFRSLVLDRVGRYRMPCLLADQIPLVATQEFVFSPRQERPVHWAEMREENSLRGTRFLNCLKGADQTPEYPSSRIDRVLRGTVLASYRFVAPDRPPEVTILFDGGSRRFAHTVESHASGFRLPCMQASDAPVRVSQMYVFAMEGDLGNYLPDGSLLQFLAGLENPAKGRPRFDFNTMGCPFDVRFMLRRPYLDNMIGEVGAPNPNRREFIEWLRDVRLKVSDSQLAVLIGSTMTISVPCTVLDLS